MQYMKKEGNIVLAPHIFKAKWPKKNHINIYVKFPKIHHSGKWLKLSHILIPLPVLHLYLHNYVLVNVCFRQDRGQAGIVPVDKHVVKWR